MENSVIKNRIIPGTVRRSALMVGKSNEKLPMREDAHERKRFIEKMDNFAISVLSVLVPKKIDRSYYERARRGLYY